MFKKEEKGISIWHVVFATVGIVLFVLASLAVLYKFFKKHFKITFECGDCDFGEDDCFCEDADFEPECCVYDDCPDEAEDAE